jgi:hypothetical protein
VFIRLRDKVLKRTQNRYFMNFKIKLDQSFRSVHRSKIYMHIFIEASAHTGMSIYIYTVFLKNDVSIKAPLERKKRTPTS